MIFDRIKEILCEQLELEEDEITLESDLQNDLGADSLDVVDLVMTLEDEYKIEIPDEAIETCHTVGDIVNYIEDNT